MVFSALIKVVESSLSPACLVRPPQSVLFPSLFQVGDPENTHEEKQENNVALLVKVRILCYVSLIPEELPFCELHHSL